MGRTNLSVLLLAFLYWSIELATVLSFYSQLGNYILFVQVNYGRFIKLKKMQGTSPQSGCHILYRHSLIKGKSFENVQLSFHPTLKINPGFFKLFLLLLYTISSVDKLKLAIGPTLLLTYFACKSAPEIKLVR